jgi:hypothetical protein
MARAVNIPRVSLVFEVMIVAPSFRLRHSVCKAAAVLRRNHPRKLGKVQLILIHGSKERRSPIPSARLV